jgi:Domain of unknown function (DUF4390)
MDFFMRLWTNALSIFVLAIAGCAAARDPLPELAIRSAALSAQSDGAVLRMNLDWRPSAAMLDALDHGIALDLRVQLSVLGAPRWGWRPDLAALTRHLQLRYYPLSRQYQLRESGGGEVRSFAARAALIAALENLRLPLSVSTLTLEQAASYRLRVGLDTDALPGALRLPALIDPAWRMRSADFAWPVPVAG